MEKSSFRQKFGNKKTGFLIRKFENREDRNKLITLVKNSFSEKGLNLVDALKYTFHQELWRNIKEYMDHCDFGLIIIDDLSPNDDNNFNPNTFLEMGYLFGLGKPVYMLIQNRLTKKIPANIRPFVYETFDTQDIYNSNIDSKISKWINDLQSRPGYLSIYFRKGHASIDTIENLKDFLSDVDCNVINDRTTETGIEEIKDLNLTGEILKIEFKIVSYTKLLQFELNFNDNHYYHAKELTQFILKLKTSKFSAIISPNESLSIVDHEELIYCPRASITGCDADIEYAKDFLKLKETRCESEIEIVILKPIKNRNSFLYVSNYKPSDDVFPIKILQEKKDGLPTNPISLIDILFIILHRNVVTPNSLSKNLDFRKKYIQSIDLHIDKIQYTVEDGIEIEKGIARNINFFKL